MSLRETQVFLTTYLRDQDFRRRYRDGEADLLAKEIGLDAADTELIRQVNLDQLDRMAEHVLAERLGRTSGVFGLLLEHLGRFVDVSERYQEFDRDFSAGWWQRRAEIRRFEIFVLDLVVTDGLPDYLVDLCRLCAQVTVVAETPKVRPDGPADLPGLTRVRANDVVRLRAPYDVLQLRHDVLRMMDDPDGYGTAPIPVPTRVLIQRDWRQHKRSRVFRVADEPVLEALLTGPATVLELGGALPHLSYSTLLSAVADLYSDGIVHLTVARELAGELAPAPAQ
jgi:hypothetical protein